MYKRQGVNTALARTQRGSVGARLLLVKQMVGRGHMGSAGARAYNEGLGTEPPRDLVAFSSSHLNFTVNSSDSGPCSGFHHLGHFK